MTRILSAIALLALIGIGVFLFVTRPTRLPVSEIATTAGDALRGEVVFNASGCASCHTAPGAGDEARLVLAGGQSFATGFGTFIAPNISQHPDHGIGGWSLGDLANALQRGVSPSGAHYYPALPYATYIRMTAGDVADLFAYMKTLPADPTPNQPHQVGFPFDQRRLLGGWKFLFLNEDWIVTGPLSAEEERGRYLVEAMGHCGECHTPRNALGGMETARWLAGAPAAHGEGRIPNITPAALNWSEEEIVEYLTSGFTPEYDSAGGEMAAVVANMARLPDADRAAIAAYLKKVPGVENPSP